MSQSRKRISTNLSMDGSSTPRSPINYPSSINHPSPATISTPNTTPPSYSNLKSQTANTSSIASAASNRYSYGSYQGDYDSAGYPSPPFASPSQRSPAYGTPPPLASPLFESPILASTSFGSSSYTSQPYPSPPYTSPMVNVNPAQLTATQETDSDADSALRFAVRYTQDLPDISEVKAACDCYIEECGDTGSSLQLCYVNRGQLDEIWLHLCSMQISKLELALLYAVLANMGVGTPVAHPRYRLESVRSPESREKFIRNAIEILEVETSQEDEESSILFTRCQALALVSWYHQSAAQYDLAWRFIKEAVNAAHTCQLFDLQEWLDATPNKLFTVKVLQMDVPYMFNWLAYSQERFSSFEPNFPEPSILIHISDPLQAAKLRHKVEGSALARKVSHFCHQADTMSKKAVIELALQLDNEILNYTESHTILRDVPPFLRINVNDRNAIRLADSVVIFRGGMMLIRYRMMLHFFQRHSLDLFQNTALSSARTTLQMLSLIQRCFESPWQSIMNRTWIDGFFNEAMFIFLTAIRSHLYEAPPMAISGDERHSDSIRAELVWFMSNFNQLFQGMKKLGLVRQPLIDCADSLRKTPVRRPNYDSTTSGNRNLSAIPIVELSRDEMDYIVDDDECNDSPNSDSQPDHQMLQNEYVSFTVFKSAFSTHNRQSPE